MTGDASGPPSEQFEFELDTAIYAQVLAAARLAGTTPDEWVARTLADALAQREAAAGDD
jgi:hypothetical protein